jgi:hypothetical protein
MREDEGKAEFATTNPPSPRVGERGGVRGDV